MTRDPGGAKAFYSAVFGWTAAAPGFEGAPESYVVWQLDGEEVGGMMELTDDFFPPEVPPHWGISFAVADCDATTDAARRTPRRRDRDDGADGHADRPLLRADRSPGRHV